MSLLDYCETQNIEYQNSREVTNDPTANILLPNKNFQINAEEIKKIQEQVEIRLNEITIYMGRQSKRCIHVIREAGCSYRLSVVPAKEYNYGLNNSSTTAYC